MARSVHVRSCGHKLRARNDPLYSDSGASKSKKGVLNSVTELSLLNISSNVVMVIQPRRMGWVGHVARMGIEMHAKFLSKLLDRRNQLERPGSGWENNIEWSLMK
jgi:hypothetical protein